MGGQLQSFGGLGQRKTMADQPLQLHLAAHNEPDGLLLQINRRTVRPDQRLLIHTNRRRIEHSFAVLGLGKQQDPTAGPNRIHRSAYQAVGPDRQNRSVGAKNEFLLAAGEDLAKAAHIPE